MNTANPITTVVNIRTGAHYDVFIGRPSLFRNPFRIGRGRAREQSIQEFRLYFYNRLLHDMPFRLAVATLKGKVLGCYCKSLACHGDVIAAYLNAGGLSRYNVR